MFGPVGRTQPGRATPFDNQSNGFASTNVQSAIEEVINFVTNPSLDQEYYVSKSGNDTSGNGTFGRPYLTVTKALSVIADASPTKRYVINVGAGDFNENIVLKANVFIYGSGPLVTRLTGTTLNINDITWNTSGADNRAGFSEMSVNPVCTFDFNAQAGNDAGKLYFWNIRTSGAWTCTANNASSGINQVIIHDSQLFGAISCVGCTTSIQDTTMGIALSVASGTVAGQGNATMTVAGGSTTSNLTATWTSNGAVSLNLRGLSTGTGTTLTASGASCTVNCAADSLPPLAQRAFSSSAVLVRMNDDFGSGVRSTTTNINFSSTVAPTAGQVPVATSGSAIVWGSASSLVSSETTATANTTTASGTDALMNSMTVTPAAGTYLVLFNTDIESNAAGAAVSLSYYLAGVQVTGSLRKTSHFDGGALSAGSARAVAQLQDIIAVNGSQAIEVRWSTSGGTATAAQRSLITLRVA